SRELHRVRLLEPPEVLDHQSERHSRSPGAGSAPALRATETHRLTPSPAASDRGGTPDSRGLTRGGRFQRTRGATSVPNSSIERSTCSCGSVPTLMWSMNRSRPRCSLHRLMLRAPVSASPSTSDPLGERRESNWARVIGPQPRSYPRWVIAIAYAS